MFGSSPEKKFNKALQQEIKDLSKEYLLFAAFEEDLQALEEAIKQAKKKEEVADLKAAFRDFQVIQNIQLRFDSHEQHRQQFETKLLEKVTIQEGVALNVVRQLLGHLRQEAAMVISSLAHYDNQIKALLEYLQTGIRRQDHLEQAQQILIDLEQIINQAKVWLKALRKNIERAKRHIKAFTKEFAEISIDDVRDKLKELPPSERIPHLLRVIRQRGMIPKLGKFIPLAIDRARNVSEATTISEQLQATIGMTPRLWKLSGDCFLCKGFYQTAADCYIHRGNREGNILAGVAYLKAGAQDMADICFRDAEITQEEAIMVAEEKVEKVF